MSRRLHIGFVLEWFPPHIGGAETLFDELTRGLVREGHEVTVVTTWVRGTPRAELRDGVRIVRVWTPAFFQRYIFTVLAVPTALRALRDVDLIHTTTYNAAIPGWVVARARKIPSVLAVHEVWAEQWGQLTGVNWLAAKAFRAFERFVLHRPFEKYICASFFTENRLRSIIGVDPKRTRVVYPAIDYNLWRPTGQPAAPFRKELGIPEDAFVYLYFGRPGVSKGLEHLLDAAVQVKAARPESRLVLILARDPLSQHQRLQERITALGLEEHVVLLEPVPRERLPSHLLAADCICVPSISEGFGYSAVEASSLGCTVVATGGHSVEEVIPMGAIFVPVGDAVALGNALLSVASGERAPRVPPPALYHVDAHLRGVEEVYAEISESGSGVWHARHLGSERRPSARGPLSQRRLRRTRRQPIEAEAHGGDVPTRSPDRSTA